MTDPERAQALSFGSVADHYDRYRPRYAAEAVTWALGSAPLLVADIGAGTGILSRVLHGLGHEVIAVEPDEHMRAQLIAVSPDITTMAGTAEKIPLPDRSVDAVVAGQAYHWFDPVRANPEIARILRPGGAFAALWNEADPRAAWTVRLVEIIDGPHVEDRPGLHLGDSFGPVEDAEFRHDMWVTPDDLIALAMTRSPYLVGTEQRRREMVDAIRRLAAGPELAGRDRFPMPLLTRVYRARRKAT